MTKQEDMGEGPRASKASSPYESNASQLRGDIQQGLTGDKRPGFDPAMAPLETDAEAGGTPLAGAEVTAERERQSRGKPNEATAQFDAAMRGVDGHRRERKKASATAFMAIAAVLVLAGIGLVSLVLS